MTGASGYQIAYRKKEQNLISIKEPPSVLIHCLSFPGKNLIRLKCALIKRSGKQNITEVTVRRRQFVSAEKCRQKNSQKPETGNRPVTKNGHRAVSWFMIAANRLELSGKTYKYFSPYP